eukprot:2215148-Pyramimonas_sp.AAC.1
MVLTSAFSQPWSPPPSPPRGNPVQAMTLAQASRWVKANGGHGGMGPGLGAGSCAVLQSLIGLGVD